MRFLHSNIWTEEIVQDVFLRIWQNRANLGDIENPSAYIYKMASNRTLDYIKQNASEIRMQVDVARKEGARDKHITENDISFRETDLLLKEAVYNLPPQRKKVFVMIREDGLTHDEIATRLSISKHSVRNHMAEALREIRQHFRENDSLVTLFLLFLEIFF